MENPYLARFRSDFGEFRVYVIVVMSRMFLYPFQTVFLLVVYCSNYSPLIAHNLFVLTPNWTIQLALDSYFRDLSVHIIYHHVFEL